MNENDGSKGQGTSSDPRHDVGTLGSTTSRTAAGEPMTGALGAVTTGTSTTTDSGTCPDCGQSLNSRILEQFLQRLGITDEMLESLKGEFENVDVDAYLDTAREYLKDSSSNAATYAKEHPGKVAAGVAALAVGAGLIYSSCNAAKDGADRARQLELREALQGRKYTLEEVLRELDVAV